MTYDTLTELIKNDMEEALGCTEPGAISLACARATAELRRVTDAGIDRIEVKVNSGIYKNAYSCGIPGTDHTGNEYAAALGAVGGDPDLGLKVLTGISGTDIEHASRLVERGAVKVVISGISPGIFVDASVFAGSHYAETGIRGSHTGFTVISVDGHILSAESGERRTGRGEQSASGILEFGFKQFREYADRVEAEKISFIKSAVRTNLDLAKAGLKWDRCTLSRALVNDQPDRISDELICGEDPDRDHISPWAYARILTGAAIEARFLGTSLPAMSITGSGAHGVISSVPLTADAYINSIDEDRLIRAVALNFLVTMYVKECSGRLSAFCGCGIAGGLGFAYALAFLRGMGDEVAARTFGNMASSITGMLCTGGNRACTMKAIAAVDAAYTALETAKSGGGVPDFCGILSDTPERTAANIGRIADPGMLETDRTIMDILESEGEYRRS
ncbi:MAG: serine dehydratase subunit alpha family protein [Lachnospiraceae bacterium]|nr:serine dehydratase subunit alpha family protein [Lachnospiraceae bacterium]